MRTQKEEASTRDTMDRLFHRADVVVIMDAIVCLPAVPCAGLTLSGKPRDMLSRGSFLKAVR